MEYDEKEDVRKQLLAEEVFVPVRSTRDNRCYYFLLFVGVLALLWVNEYKFFQAEEEWDRPNYPIDKIQPSPFVALPANSSDINVYVFDGGKNPFSTRLAANVAIGLLNRAAEEGRPAAYALLRGSPDHFWINETIEETLKLNAAPGVVNLIEASWDEIIMLAFDRGLIKGKIIYNNAENYSLPTVVSIAGINDAIPLPADFALTADLLNNNENISSLPLVFDARKKWLTIDDQVDSVEYVMKNWLHMSDNLNLAMQKGDLLRKGFLVDYIVSKRITTIWIDEVCFPWTEGGKTFRKITQNNPHWSTEQPLSIMGYYGGFFESVGVCTERRTEFAYVSDIASGLSFMEKMPEITKADNLTHPPTEPIIYDPSKTYVMIMTSDGDNLQIIQASIMLEFNEKQRLCDIAADNGLDMDKFCPRQTWTFHGRTAEIAPNYLQYFYKAALKHGRDSFIQGPTGYGYLYPALINEESDADRVAELTIELAELTEMNAYSHWDWTLTFPWTISYMRRFAGTAIEGMFISTVPAFIPQLYFASEDVLQDDNGDLQIFVEDFRWARPGNNKDGRDWTSDQVAERYNNKPKGSLSYIYKIHDVPTALVLELAQKLDDHVVLVDYKQMMDLRRQKTKLYGYPNNPSYGLLAFACISFAFLVYVCKRYY